MSRITYAATSAEDYQAKMEFIWQTITARRLVELRDAKATGRVLKILLSKLKRQNRRGRPL